MWRGEGRRDIIIPMSETGRLQRRRWAVPALSAFGTLTLASLAVATNLATELIPESWEWTRESGVVWSIFAILLAGSVALAWAIANVPAPPEMRATTNVENVRVDLVRNSELESTLDITVRNLRELASVVHELDVANVNRYWFGGSHPLAALYPSARYFADLEEAYSRGETYAVRISQSIDARSTDRFLISMPLLGMPPTHGGILYEFDACLIVDSDRVTVHLGRYLVCHGEAEFTRFLGHIRRRGVERAEWLAALRTLVRDLLVRIEGGDLVTTMDVREGLIDLRMALD